MALKIDGTGYYDQSINQARKVNTIYQKENAPSFSMEDYQDGGVIYEPGGNKDNRKERIASEAAMRAQKQATTQDAVKDSGVRLDLSKEAVATQKESQASVNGDVSTLWNQIKNVAISIRKLFMSIWSGEPIDGTKAKEAIDNKIDGTNATDFGVQSTDETGTKAAESVVVDESIIGQVGADRPLTYEEKVALFLKENATMMLTNDPEEMKRFMVNYDGRRLAKNSNTVTYYNKQGKIVEPPGSDKQRILQMERSSTKV